MWKDWLGYVSPGIGFSGAQDLGIQGILGRDLESHLRTSHCFVPVIVDINSERNLNARLHDGRWFETDGVIGVALSESQPKTQEQAHKDLHVFSVGPAIGSPKHPHSRGNRSLSKQLIYFFIAEKQLDSACNREPLS
jgi:hypothetical protein